MSSARASISETRRHGSAFPARSVHPLCGQVDGDGGSDSRRTLDHEASSVKFDQGAGYRQPEAGAWKLARKRRLHEAERLERPWDIRFGDPDPGIL